MKHSLIYLHVVFSFASQRRRAHAAGMMSEKPVDGASVAEIRAAIPGNAVDHTGALQPWVTHIPQVKMQLLAYPKEGCTVWKMLFMAKALNFASASEWSAYRKTWKGNVHQLNTIPGKWEGGNCDGCKVIFPMRDPHLRVLSSYRDNEERARSVSCLRDVFGTPWPSLNEWFKKVADEIRLKKRNCFWDHRFPLSELGAFEAWDAAKARGSQTIAFDLPDTMTVAHEELGLPSDLVAEIVRDGTSHSHRTQYDGLAFDTTTYSLFEELYKDDISFYKNHSVPYHKAHLKTSVGHLLSGID